jgi:hypothetical protein
MEHVKTFDPVSFDWPYYRAMAKRQLITLATMWLALVTYSALQGQCYETRSAQRSATAGQEPTLSQQCGLLACKLVEPWR